MHVGVLDFSGLLVKLQNVSHPKSDKDGDGGRGDKVGLKDGGGGGESSY